MVVRSMVILSDFVRKRNRLCSKTCLKKMTAKRLAKIVIFRCPTNIGITRATPTATPLVVISDGGQNLGCVRLLYGFFFFTIFTPALALGQPITKCTLAILVVKR